MSNTYLRQLDRRDLRNGNHVAIQFQPNMHHADGTVWISVNGRTVAKFNADCIDLQKLFKEFNATS